MSETKRPRICWMIDSLGMGGAERLFESYFRFLDRERYDYRVCVLHERHGNMIAKNVEAMGIPVDMVPVRRLRDLSAVGRMAEYLHEQQIDLLHTQLEFSNTMGSRASKKVGIPATCLLHTMDDPPMNKSYYWRLRISYASLSRYSDRVLAVSEAVRQHHIRKLRAFRPDHIETMYAGIDLDPFEPRSEARKAEIRASLGIPAGRPVITTVAVLYAEKGVQYMIRALPQILKAAPDIMYLVAGDGQHRAALEAEVAELGLQNQVLFAGMRDDVADLLAISTLFVLPTVYDALPTVLSESMGTRLPLVGSDVGGVPEMIQHEVNGLLTRPADPDSLAAACIRILSDPAEAARMGERGRAIVEEKFNVRVQARRLEDLYDRLLRQYGRI